MRADVGRRIPVLVMSKKPFRKTGLHISGSLDLQTQVVDVGANHVVCSQNKVPNCTGTKSQNKLLSAQFHKRRLSQNPYLRSASGL